jgi:hypothetical protein
MGDTSMEFIPKELPVDWDSLFEVDIPGIMNGGGDPDILDGLSSKIIEFKVRPAHVPRCSSSHTNHSLSSAA